MKYIFILPVLFASYGLITAQVGLQSFIDAGESHVSEGIFIKNVYRTCYRYQNYHIEAGLQFDLHSINPNTLTGFDMIGGRKFAIRNIPVDAKGFFLLNRFSDLFYETNWGIRIESRKLDHFLIELGTGFKTYSINSAARREYKVSKSDSKFRENFNLLYTASAFVMPHGSNWNIGLSCTNIDYYVINQSTNPVFNLQTKYKSESGLTLFLEAWYKQAGILNINANYFGYFFRGGVKWEL